MKKRLFLFVLITVNITTCLSQTRYYVSAAGTPTGNALSWQTACSDLQLVINNAAPYDTIWVAQGTYVPIRPADSLWKIDTDNRHNAFTVTKGLCLYGGFIGNETDISQRQFPAQGSNGLTVLSGDIGVLNDSTDNTHHVVLLIAPQDTIILNGFTITGGGSVSDRWLYVPVIVNGKSISNQTGKGICCISSLIASHLTVTKNSSHFESGTGIFAGENSFSLSHSIVSYNNNTLHCSGIYTSAKNITISHTLITHNTGGNDGAGFCIQKTRNCTLSHVAITDNGRIGGSGGGIAIFSDIYSYSSILLDNVLIAGNKAQGFGSGIYASGTFKTFTITNSTIVNNILITYNSNPLNTDKKGAIHLFSSIPHNKQLQIRNSIIWGNTYQSRATQEIVDANIDSISALNCVFSNCILGPTLFLDNNHTYTDSIWISTPAGAMNKDPLFVDTANGDFRLQCGSPAVNMGNNAFYHPDSFPNLSHIITDLDGNSRFFNHDIDIGAYELQKPCAPFIWVADTVFTCYGDSTEIAIRFSGTAPWDLVYTLNNGASYDTLKNIWDNTHVLKLYLTDTLRIYFSYIQDILFDNVLSDSVYVNIIRLPILTSFLGNDTLCSGEQTKAVVFEGIADNYQWEAKGDSIYSIPRGLQTGNFDSYVVENNDTLSFTTTITVMPYVTVSNKTCYGLADSFSITVRPVIQLKAGVNDSLFCEGDSILFVLFNTSVSDVVWQGNETILDEENAVIPDAKPAHSGMYVVRARKANYCVLPDTVQITVLSAIITDMEDTLYMCDWEDITIYSNAANANDYLWNTGETSANINVSNPGTYYLEATNERCIVFDTVEVIQIQVSEFTISSSGDLCDGKEVELTATIDNVSYQWNTGDTSKTIIVSVEGFYSVTIEAGHCQAYKELEINCPCKIVLPNVFTPVQGKEYLPIVNFTLNSYSIHIYDRWGNIVFQTNNLSPWDGTNKGKPISDGVYYCVVSYTCTDMPEKILTTQSSITVMR